MRKASSTVSAGLYTPGEAARLARSFSGGYLLVVRLASEARLTFGAAGTRRLKPGYYVYAGSALGRMGWRLLRHLGLLRRKARWHIDYLLRMPAASVVAVGLLSARRKVECELSRHVSREADHSLPGLGSTDCGCPSHLHYFRKRSAALRAVETAIRRASARTRKIYVVHLRRSRGRHG